MQTNDDKSVTLTAKEWEELNNAYQKLFHFISNGPSYIGIGDHCESKAELLRIVRWQAQLNGEIFDAANWS